MNFVANRSFECDRTFIDLLPMSWFQLEINSSKDDVYTIRYDRPVTQRVGEFRRMSFEEKLSFLEEIEGSSIFHKGFSEALKRNARYLVLLSLIEEYNDHNDHNDHTHTPRRKKTIPKALRARVWHTYIGQEIGMTKCMCCETSDITSFNFECGHIIPESKGGSTTINNLRPICGTCNRSMGSMDMNDFINMYFPKSLE